MNAKPTQITISIAVSNKFSLEDLIGGDTNFHIKKIFFYVKELLRMMF